MEPMNTKQNGAGTSPISAERPAESALSAAAVEPVAPPPPAVTATTLWTEPCLLVVADDHPLAGRAVVEVADLTGQTFIAVGDTPTSDHWLGDVLREAPRTLPIARTFDVLSIKRM